MLKYCDNISCQKTDSNYSLLRYPNVHIFFKRIVLVFLSIPIKYIAIAVMRKEEMHTIKKRFKPYGSKSFNHNGIIAEAIKTKKIFIITSLKNREILNPVYLFNIHKSQISANG